MFCHCSYYVSQKKTMAKVEDLSAAVPHQCKILGEEDLIFICCSEPNLSSYNEALLMLMGLISCKEKAFFTSLKIHGTQRGVKELQSGERKNKTKGNKKYHQQNKHIIKGKTVNNTTKQGCFLKDGFMSRQSNILELLMAVTWYCSDMVFQLA